MQRKRHINFKYWKDKIRSSTLTYSVHKQLHSIPTLSSYKNKIVDDIAMKNVKSSVLYSIPCGCVLALLLIEIANLLIPNTCYAFGMCPDGECGGTATDYTSISSVSGGTTTPATASLSLSNSNMTSSAVMPGDTATVSTNVIVNVSNASNYSLTLKVDSAHLTANGTTLTAGNVTTDNTWGYKWDNASSYTAPSTTAQTLTVPALSNNAVSFTKNLTFGAKFASSAEAGHYKGSGTLSLVATPKAATYTLADLTQMQQLAEGYAPDACKNTTIPSEQDYAGPYNLTDVRDNSTYTVYKFKDNKCWMTQNLKLSDAAPEGNHSGGRVLNSTTSDVSANWTLPASSTSGFSDNTASNAYITNNTGYYTWCAATAGTCSSATSGGQNASSSICPKGWKLPTGMVTGSNTSNDFYNLFKNMGLTISGSLSATSNTSWGSGDLAKVQGSPYNFAYTGYMYDRSGPQNTSGGYWWSRTAYNSNNAYYLYIDGSLVGPGTYYDVRRRGFAVRCVAQ